MTPEFIKGHLFISLLSLNLSLRTNKFLYQKMPKKRQQKQNRRARERQAKKEKKRQKAEKRAVGELDEDDEEEERNRKAKKQKLDFGGTVVIDLGFDDMMLDKEIKSLCSQLAYTYSTNRNASFPFSLIFSSLNGRTFERLESLGEASYKRWASTTWWTSGYEQLWIAEESNNVPTVPTLDLPEAVATPENNDASASIPTSKIESKSDIHTYPRDKIVYLTADTDEELTELLPDEIYIIGGIVDHNRYKNLCFSKAKESGVRTACLPIGRFLASLPTRKVLTVNQVFEILVKWVECKDWEEALYSVIPKRKFHQGGKANSETNIDQIADEGAADDEAIPHQEGSS
ncbi:guanine-1-methyltransferase-domain-containing protein [Panaeolus papilionaceus]|nr:guanine-1-methyltransferase-domain-containing protein [Panaeolus papilionaceus]